MALDRNQYIGICLALVVLIVTYLVFEFRKNNIENNPIKTIGFVNGYLRGAKSGPALLYVYNIGSVEYQGSTYINSDEYSKHRNRFYIIRYSSKNPSWSELLLDEPVTDTTAIKAAGFTIPRKKRNQFQE